MLELSAFLIVAIIIYQSCVPEKSDYNKIIFKMNTRLPPQIVHLDLKPDNILCKETEPGIWHAKIIDFGEAERGLVGFYLGSGVANVRSSS